LKQEDLELKYQVNEVLEIKNNMKNQLNRSDWLQQIFHIQKIENFLTDYFLTKLGDKK